MSIFKKIAEMGQKISNGVEVGFGKPQLQVDFTELCEHLRQIGVKAMVLERENPEVKELLDAIGGLGYIKIEGWNLDLIKGDHIVIQKPEQAGGGKESKYIYNYVVRGKVDTAHTFQKGISDYLAEGKSIKKGFIRKEVVDYRWDGRELAQRLNADADLTNMLIKERIDDMCITYKQNGNVEYVEIGPSIGYWLEKKSFPTREAFDIYDRIASHIRSITDARS